MAGRLFRSSLFAGTKHVRRARSSVNGADQARGILDTREIDVVAIDGSIVSEQRTILDVRDAEFNTVPVQGDQIAIPADGTLPDEGTWEVID